MKICMATHDFPPLTGGISSHVYDLSRTMVSMGHEVTVVTCTQKGEKERETIEGIHVIRLRRNGKGKINSIKYMLRAIREINQHDFDVVHYHNLLPESIITKLIKQRPRIFTAHESRFLLMSEKTKNSLFLRWLLKHPNYVIAPSQELLDTATSFGFPKEKGEFIPNGVDPSKFNPYLNGQRIRQKYGVNDDEVLILVPRRLVEKNGVMYLIQSAPAIIRRHKNVVFLITGDGPERVRIEDQLKKDKTSKYVLLAGNVNYAEMPLYYAASDIVVLPSLKEATSIAGLEAMACGKPLVGTNVGGIPYIIEDKETGFIVPPRNPDALAEKINILLSDRKLREKFGKRARRRVEKDFTWDVIAERTLKIYREVTE